MARVKERTPVADRLRLTVYLEPETYRALMQRALDDSAAAGERVSATQIVEKLITQYLKKGTRT